MFKCKPLPPFLVLNDAGAEGSSNPPAEPNPDEFLPGDADLSDDEFKAKRGFPRKTPKDQMTQEERELSWRYEAKKQQHTVEALRRDMQRWEALGAFDAVNQALSDAETARQASLTDQQKADENAQKARDAAEATGFARAQALYLRPVVQTLLVAQTRRADESKEDAIDRVTVVLDALDVTKFVTDNGSFDAEKVETFAKSLAPKDGDGSGTGAGDPLVDALSRQHPSDPGHSGSVAAMEASVYERLTKK